MMAIYKSDDDGREDDGCKNNNSLGGRLPEMIAADLQGLNYSSPYALSSSLLDATFFWCSSRAAKCRVHGGGGGVGAFIDFFPDGLGTKPVRGWPKVPLTVDATAGLVLMLSLLGPLVKSQQLENGATLVPSLSNNFMPLEPAKSVISIFSSSSLSSPSIFSPSSNVIGTLVRPAGISP